MAMVISPRSKIVTLSLLIGIITVVAFIVTVIGIWHKSEKPGKTGTKVVSSKLQQITGYTATKHLTNDSDECLRRLLALVILAKDYGLFDQNFKEAKGLKLDNGFFFFLRKIIHQKCLDIDDQSLSSARRLVKRMSD
ncbi:hypothetical protein APICC_00320 [Apis cerana cerana]|uniref:Uncharacterized protein n=1 Tax=Apis cerana cerana TaxID=94128 RepID=A0A2A3ECQ2_APICC|nr:hypothetical protein APICC_00320 [Apis cerana cerana]